MGTDHVSDGERDVTADDLKTGRLYVLEEKPDGAEHLRHLPRRDDALPKLRVMEGTSEKVRTFRNGMRKKMHGFRPELPIVTSALLEHAMSLPEAPDVVRTYAAAIYSLPDADRVPTDKS